MMGSLRSAVLAVAGALALAACGSDPGDQADRTPPSPALWEVASADGTLEGWLFGTVHALPDGTAWETSPVTEAIERAEVLMVEIAALENSAAISHVFARLARAEGLPPLSRRLPADEQAALRELLAAGSYSEGDFGATESWAAALMLAQGATSGDPANGVDRALIRRFQGKPIRELEGPERQLGIFDRLPETDQRALLSAVVAEGTASAAERGELVALWRRGDMERLARENTEGLLADPTLREALLVNRNQDWAEQLARVLPGTPPALIAVGAAHMAGPEGLPAMMRQRGYTVRRVQ